MKIGLPKINDALSMLVLYVSIFYVPFFRYGPVKDLCAGWHVVNLDRYMLSNDMQRLANSVTGDAPTNRIQLSHQLVHFKPDIGHLLSRTESRFIHGSNGERPKRPTTKDTKITKLPDQSTNRLTPFFNTSTLKLISNPTFILASFM